MIRRYFLLWHMHNTLFVLFYDRRGPSKTCRTLFISANWFQSAMFQIFLISTTLSRIHDVSNSPILHSFIPVLQDSDVYILCSNFWWCLIPISQVCFICSRWIGHVQSIIVRPTKEIYYTITDRRSLRKIYCSHFASLRDVSYNEYGYQTKSLNWKLTSTT